METNSSNLISLADASAATLERLTDRFGLILADIRRLDITRQEQFKILEKRISHILQLQELAAGRAESKSSGVAA